MIDKGRASQEESDFARIRRIATLSPMADNTLSELLRLGRTVSFGPGDVIIRQSELGDAVFALIEGDVEVVNESQHGRSILARIAGPALVGEITALARIPRTATVVAVTSVRALRLEREAFLRLSRDAPDILISVIGQLGKNIQNVNRALGLYADSFSALEREDLDTAIIDDLNKPLAELRDFANAFHRLAQHIVLERRNRNELASAAMIQQAMVPQTLAGLDKKGRCDLFGDMKTAREVGGDFYDAVMLGENQLMLVIGDVCGKGVPASLFMSIAITIVRLAARQSRDVSAAMEWANSMLFAQNASSLFATAFYGVLDLESGRLDYVNCGHNPPFVLQRGGSCLKLAGGGLPLGIFAKKAVTANSIALSPGDSLFLYTDGITESIDALGAEYGDDRLTETLGQAQGGDAEALCRSALEDVAAFTKGVDQLDDITCLAVRFGRLAQSVPVLPKDR